MVGKDGCVKTCGDEEYGCGMQKNTGVVHVQMEAEIEMVHLQTTGWHLLMATSRARKKPGRILSYWFQGTCASANTLLIDYLLVSRTM